jgi:hypothetical protein
MAEWVLVAVVVVVMVAGPPGFVIGLAMREQRLRARAAD